jgi:TolB-like protein/DNA-binding winged helix-turn-helix (wHTH) protein/tetratricopeptide (TPR) repeat protein
MSDLSSKIYTFGAFRIDLDQRRLFRAGDSVPLTPKAFDTLAVLVERQGRIVEKAELLKLVWPDAFVEENNLTQNISALRKAFGDQGYIETIPRRGYRFMIAVEAVSASDALPPVQTERVAAGRRFPGTWVGAVLAAAVVGGLGFFVVNRIGNDRHRANHVDSLVVLPFVNLTANLEDEYFSDGLTEEVTNAAAHLDGLRVVARTTAYQFKGKARDIRSIAKQLQVTTVLEGSVRRQEKKLRVTVQLNDAETGYHMWSQTYDRDLGDMWAIQEDISNEVARTIRPDGPTVHAVTGSHDREAYNLYLLGRFHRTQPDQASVRRAIAFFEQAVEKDPGYAAAYAGLAESYVKLAQGNFVAPVEAWAAAQKVVDKALSLDNRLSEAHTTQAIIHLLMDRNWKAAEAEFRRAIALNPNDAAAHHWFSHYFTVMGRVSESLAESRKALMLSPLDIQISSHLISNYVRARDFPRAINAGLQTLELDSHSQLAYLFLMWAYEDTEQWDKAIDASQRAGKTHPEESALRAAVHSDGAQGYWRVTQALLAKQEKPDNFRLAVCYARLREGDNSLARLEQAFQRREPESLYVKSEPAFDWMRSNPRFKALTASVRLP